MLGLMVHPDHPGALAVLDEEGTPQFVIAAQVVERFERLCAHVERLEVQVDKLERNGKPAVDDDALSALVRDAVWGGAW